MGDYNKAEFLNFIGDSIVSLQNWNSGRGVRPHILLGQMREMSDTMLAYSTSLPPGEAATACEKTARYLVAIRVSLTQTGLTDTIKLNMRRASHLCSHILSGDLPVDFSSCPCCCKKCGKKGKKDTANHVKEEKNAAGASKEVKASKDVKVSKEAEPEAEVSDVSEAGSAAEESDVSKESSTAE
ncbi:uncharacterized protein N7496_008374 [Penicillium cataractarum]|uniref:Uncharacterized protein n=1 Tax=Penicillium cataractarum TaxID=2100454 RepID=A0A9W9S0V5_9EURO|nr:uncharacterized protein N7496_008374 [Penicillium cataractarum]KAJ5368614.1 hypothetical protein N7496_008374 [Penicillium cataractarum]